MLIAFFFFLYLAGWVAENLYWHSNDEFAISRNNSRIRPMDNAVYKRFPAAKVWNFPIN